MISNKIDYACKLLRCAATEASQKIMTSLKDGEEKYITEIMANKEFYKEARHSTFSKNLSDLHKYGYVDRRQDGIFVYYKVNEEKVSKINRIISELVNYNK